MSPRGLGIPVHLIRSRKVRSILLRERQLARANRLADRWMAKAEPYRTRASRLRAAIAALEGGLNGSQRGELDRARREAGHASHVG